jgi:hypothetical protein
MIAMNVYAKALQLQPCTAQEWAVGGILCFLLPSVYVFFREQQLHRQYLLHSTEAIGAPERHDSTSSKQLAAKQDADWEPIDMEGTSGAPESGLKQRKQPAHERATTSSSGGGGNSSGQGVQLGQQPRPLMNKSPETGMETAGVALGQCPLSAPAAAAALSVVAPASFAGRAAGVGATGEAAAAATMGDVANVATRTAVTMYRTPLVYRHVSIKVVCVKRTHGLFVPTIDGCAVIFA